MIFILGYITGLITAAIIFLILAYFKPTIENRIKIVEKKLDDFRPKPTGAIFLPKNDADIARENYIAKNKAMGKDTPISELL